MLYARKFRPHEGLTSQSAANMVAKIILEKLQDDEISFGGFPEITLQKVGSIYHLILKKGEFFSSPVVFEEYEAVKMAIQFLKEEPLNEDITAKVMIAIKQLDDDLFFYRITKQKPFNQ